MSRFSITVPARYVKTAFDMALVEAPAITTDAVGIAFGYDSALGGFFFDIFEGPDGVPAETVFEYSYSAIPCGKRLTKSELFNIAGMVLAMSQGNTLIFDLERKQLAQFCYNVDRY